MARKKNKADKGQYRVQASTEAEVARARLARARQALEYGDTVKALDLAVESAFDAGISKTYALLSGERDFQKVADGIVDEAQDFVREIAAIEPFQRASNPKTSATAMKLARKSTLMGAMFYAGGAHGYARVNNDQKMLASTIKFYDEVYAPVREEFLGTYRMQVVSNPGRPPRSTSKLKSRLLR